jgi:hypothetical protein
LVFGCDKNRPGARARSQAIRDRVFVFGGIRRNGGSDEDGPDWQQHIRNKEKRRASAGHLHRQRWQRNSKPRHSKAIAVMLEKHEIACGMMHGFDWSSRCKGTPAEKMALLPPAQEHILQQEKGKERFVQIVTELS